MKTILAAFLLFAGCRCGEGTEHLGANDSGATATDSGTEAQAGAEAQPLPPSIEAPTAPPRHCEIVAGKVITSKKEAAKPDRCICDGVEVDFLVCVDAGLAP